MNSNPEPQHRVIEETNRKQRNTVWPDTMLNGRNVDEFLWKGSPDAPLVQRIGACIFGVVFMLGGVGMIESVREMSPDRKSPASVFVSVLIALLFVLGGLKVFMNGFRRLKGTARKTR